VQRPTGAARSIRLRALPNPRNVERVWQRVRRKAQKAGVRPLKLRCGRHTWATLALQAGKSLRRVADVLGRADPALTLRVYAHAIRQAEADLSFADFGGLRRPPRGPSPATSVAAMAPREGLEPPTLRFEARGLAWSIAAVDWR